MSDAAHTDHTPGLAHHFEDFEQQNESASLGMWAFLITEVMFFGGLFLGYALYRTYYPEAFAAASHELSVGWGAFNTVVLIGSSLTMALAVRAAQLGQPKSIVRYIVYTLLLGIGFLGVKAVEYAAKFEHHLVPGPHFLWGGDAGPEVELFFGFYFCMTGLHALHMLIGMVLMGVVVVRARRGVYTPANHIGVEMLGLYWHFVDLVWIFLFPMLYLIGRHVG